MGKHLLTALNTAEYCQVCRHRTVVFYRENRQVAHIINHNENLGAQRNGKMSTILSGTFYTCYEAHSLYRVRCRAHDNDQDRLEHPIELQILFNFANSFIYIFCAVKIPPRERFR